MLFPYIIDFVQVISICTFLHEILLALLGLSLAAVQRLVCAVRLFAVDMMLYSVEDELSIT